MKRTVDLLLVILSAPFVLALIGAVAILVCLRIGLPILFRQERIGLNGSTFTLVKFRTMRVPKPGEDALATDEERLTPLGRFLRSTSLDELPSLWNVLVGDMSLVGPRPLLPSYMPLYTPEQARRHQVRPGITGWAQVHGRNAVPWNERFELDVWYVDHHTIWLDIRILGASIGAVIAQSGVNAPGHATAPPFSGPALPKGPDGTST